MTTKIEPRYSEPTLSILRQRRELQPDDTSQDDKLNQMSPERAFRQLVAWHLGHTNWADSIQGWLASTNQTITPIKCDCNEVEHNRKEAVKSGMTIEEATSKLAECFRVAGADCDGNEDWRIAPDAPNAVAELRKDYDDCCDEVEHNRKEAVKLLERCAQEITRLYGGQPITTLYANPTYRAVKRYLKKVAP